jgi:hypothetical protein
VQFFGSAEAPRRDERFPDQGGTIFRAAPDGNSIVVEVAPTERGEQPRRLIFKLSEKTTVTFHNVPLDSAKAAVGMQARVWLAEGSKVDAAKVSFTSTAPERWKTLSGKVVAVAKDGKSFTMEAAPTVRGEEPKRTEVKLTDKTKLSFSGVGPGEAKVSDGLIATVRLLDGSTDTASQAQFQKPGGRDR